MEKNQLQSFKESLEKCTSKNYFLSFDWEKHDCVSNAIYEFLLQIKNDSLRNCTPYNSNIFENPNFYSNDHFLSVAINILVLFPMWTNIISNDVNIFKKVEKITALQEHKTNLKNIFTNEVSADNFFTKYVKFIDSSLEDGFRLVDDQLVKNASKKTTNLACNYLRYQENWKGKADVVTYNDEFAEEQDEKTLTKKVDQSIFDSNFKNISFVNEDSNKIGGIDDNSNII